MSILKITDLVVKYGSKPVLKGIDLEIDSPGIYALVGPNGSGKTTLLNAISNLIPKSSGKITVFNSDNSNISNYKDMSYFPDQRVLYPYLTGYDHFNILMNVYKIDKGTVKRTIEKFNIESYIGKKVGEYSLGMKQHLLIALSSVIKPKLMILDEPMNGLDPSNIVKIRKLLIDIANEGTAILISSHNLFEIDMMTSKVYFLKDGKLMYEELKLEERVIFSFEKDIVDESIKTDTRFKIEGSSIEVNTKDISKSEALSILGELPNKIVDFKIQSKSSEDRYREIFEI
ncbi:ABC transporter ATP-binding protein [Microaceticoccus formicicus]|uniref:ABC transporter ATP-binding protein n=1 Tax=Microaceticoccus formicicus TaxID=3118105 RepID=UPI003CD035F6|nr:ABC transporter ATP-binding protein [Peptoniphilaceae bacterium AMB_02]